MICPSEPIDAGDERFSPERNGKWVSETAKIYRIDDYENRLEKASAAKDAAEKQKK